MLLTITTRLSWVSLLITFLLYPAAAWAILRFFPAGSRKTAAFAGVNIFGAYLACVAIVIEPVRHGGHALLTVTAGFLTYLALILVNYALLRLTNVNQSFAAAALWFPIACLVLIKYVPALDHSFSSALHTVHAQHLSVLFLGLSYLTFRLCHLVQEVRNGAASMPSMAEYLSFAFFVPTLSIGPINPYSRYIESYRNHSTDRSLVNRALLRILVGLTKYVFLATLLSQYTYSGLILDGHPHAKIDLVIAVFAYSLFLYCNFSGFCDMVIGISGLIGIDVMENFNAPFTARNFQEFWSRWHISLSQWLRDMMFTPMVKALVRVFGPRSANHAIAFTICVVFILIGIWHGVGINFALFGLSQGLGVAAVHYYTIFLKKRLGKQGFAAYRANRFIAAGATATTFVYFSLSLFLFANTWDNMQKIFKALV